MKVVTWNVNGIRAREAQLLEWVERESPDVLCLQEIKASPEHVPELLSELAGYYCYWHGHKGYSGVALLLKKTRFGAKPRFVHPAFDHENRIVTAQIDDLVLGSVYVPNGGKDFSAKVKFLAAMEDYVASLREQKLQLILCGDLNVARTERDVHEKLRNNSQIGQTQDERNQIERILSHGLVDLGRQFEPDNDQLFTWWAPWRNMKDRNIGWRLDYFLVSESIAAHAKGCAAFREFGTSDHSPVQATFDDQAARFVAPSTEQSPDPTPPAPREVPAQSGQLPLKL